jgi:hypothetical protein
MINFGEAPDPSGICDQPRAPSNYDFKINPQIKVIN